MTPTPPGPSDPGGMPSRAFFGEEASFHHVGMVVRSIEKTAPGARSWEDPIQRVRVTFLTVHGAPIELVEPVGERSPVRRSLDKGKTLLHLCFQVPNLEAALRAGSDSGFSALGPPAPAAAFDGRRICWVYHREFGLVELLEAPP